MINVADLIEAVEGLAQQGAASNIPVVVRCDGEGDERGVELIELHPVRGSIHRPRDVKIVLFAGAHTRL